MTSKVGRPSNKQLLAEGKIPISKACKVCQSGARDEITQMILSKTTYREVITKFGHLFDSEFPLSPTNLHSHKQHMNVEAAVKADRATIIKAVVEYDETTKDLFKHRYDEEFDKVAAADLMYKQRLSNLLGLQNEVEELNAKEKADDAKTLGDADQGLRRKLLLELEVAYRGFNQDLIKHIQLDADLYTKQVSVQYINQMKESFLRFTQKFMDVLVKEINDSVTRERITEQLGDLLDEEVSPNLDPAKAIATEFTEISDVKSS